MSVRGFLFLYLKCLMMKNLLMTRFFALLAEDWKENLEPRVYEDAIREFTSEIRMLCDTEKDYVGLVRMLEQTRIGLEYWLERVSGDSETEKKWTGAVLYQRGFEVGGGRGAFVT